MKLKFTISTTVEVTEGLYPEGFTTKDILEVEKANFDMGIFEDKDTDDLDLKVELVCPTNQPELPGLPQPQQSSQPACHQQ